MRKVLVTGADGQLGLCFREISVDQSSLTYVFCTKETLNILSAESIEQVISKELPDYVVNCAAYTAVDSAEEDSVNAYRLNQDAVADLAKVCNAYGATLIHISTDFVFEGKSVSLLSEEAPTNPINVYGKSKLAGELALKSILEQHIVIRTSWLYSEHGANFLKTMLRLGSERTELSVVADQVGTPTYAMDLARAVEKMINANAASYGVYHYSNEGVTSWYDFAAMIFKLAKMPIKVQPIGSVDYPTKAQRPGFSVMDKRKIKKDYHVIIPHWTVSLENCMQKLHNDNFS